MVRYSMAFLQNFGRSVAALFVVTTVGAFGFAGPARADLDVAAPSPAQARQLQSWYDQHMPARFRAHSKLTVRELSDQDMDAYLKADQDPSDNSFQTSSGDDNSEIDGVFEGDPDRIALRLPTAGSLDMFTFAHEYGHYVWFHLMSRDDHKRYEGIYNRQRAAHHLVTRYASTDVEEGFAEAFSFYANAAPMLERRDPLSFQFFNQWNDR
ncbi:MAG: hypothetical protein M3Y28_11095 [Armatimonadota bacterium]|nr:hypothetical protein [Armatimonadota bacterium]